MLLKWYQLINRSVDDNHEINFLPGSDLIRSNVFFLQRDKHNEEKMDF